MPCTNNLIFFTEVACKRSVIRDNDHNNCKLYLDKQTRATI